MLTIKDLYFRHSHNEADILKGIAFAVSDGLMTTILGPNGSGKTTLFKCMTGLWHPRQGAVLFSDQDLSKLSYGRRAGIIAVVPQEHEPPFPYTVADVVLMGRVSHVSLFSTPSKEDHLAAEAATENMGIGHLRERAYTKLSGGERQLVLIARALAQEAPILILDEPTSHLDFRNQILILSKVREIVREKNLTVLMTLHDPNLAMQFSDYVVMMNEGRILAKGLPQMVLTKDNLMKMFSIDVSVISHNGTMIIYPEAAS
ncbi:MAG: ABC transporter ATP-binding protein [Syntrophales bacterium]|nr:ABC transporter ATP-binding protein [Syntrophales bacterium]